MDTPTRPNPDADPLDLMGHNNPPEVLPYNATTLAELKAKADQFIAVSDEWKDVEITSDTLAGQLLDQVDGLKKRLKDTEKAREEAKKPHLTAGRKVDADFNAVKSLIQSAIDRLQPKLNKYAHDKAEKERIRQQEDAEAARRAQAAAQMQKAQAQQTGSIKDQHEADQAEQQAQVAIKKSKPQNTQIKSASGAGRTMATRKRKHAQIVNIRQLFLHYQERPEVQDLLQRLANAEANSAGFPEDGKIPGTDITTKTTLA